MSWYDKDTFKNVFKFLEEGYDGVFGLVENEKNVHANPFPSHAQKLTYSNHCGAMSASIFLKFDSSLSFDENIGVGSPYNLWSGEETDYLLTYMEKHPHFNFYYTPEIIVRHPVTIFSADKANLNKHYLYARGAGYVLKKHTRLSVVYKLTQFIRPLGGMLIYGVTNKRRFCKSYYLFKGRLEGFFIKIEK